MIPPWLGGRMLAVLGVLALLGASELGVALNLLPLRVAVWTGGLPLLMLVFWQFRILWFHLDDRFDRPNRAWFWSHDIWRAMLRAWVPGSIVIAMFFAFPEWFDTRRAKDVWLWIFILVGVLMLTTMLVNQPKWIVAPHLRSQPGMLSEWWAAFKEWRRTGRIPPPDAPLHTERADPIDRASWRAPRDQN